MNEDKELVIIASAFIFWRVPKNPGIGYEGVYWPQIVVPYDGGTLTEEFIEQQIRHYRPRDLPPIAVVKVDQWRVALSANVPQTG